VRITSGQLALQTHVDQAKLEALYAPQDNSRPGGAFREKKIVIKRDDDLMNVGR
jgi:hypothetical protein